MTLLSAARHSHSSEAARSSPRRPLSATTSRDRRGPRICFGSAGRHEDPRMRALSWAILAPNPHNRQPWIVDRSEPNAVTLRVDTGRLLPHADPFQPPDNHRSRLFSRGPADRGPRGRAGGRCRALPGGRRPPGARRASRRRVQIPAGRRGTRPSLRADPLPALAQETVRYGPPAARGGSPDTRSGGDPRHRGRHDHGGGRRRRTARAEPRGASDRDRDPAHLSRERRPLPDRAT